MEWDINKFFDLEVVDPGLILGQIDFVCAVCYCSFTVQYSECDDDGVDCPNCCSRCDL